MRLPIVTVFFLLTLSYNSCAQADTTTPRISVSFEEIILMDVLSYLQVTYAIDFSHGNTVILDRRVSIQATDLPLITFLERLCEQLDLTFRVINSHIVLRKMAPERTALPHSNRRISRLPASLASDLAAKAARQSLKPVKKLQPIALLLPHSANGFLLAEIRKSEVTSIVFADPLESLRKGKGAGLSIGISVSYDDYHYNFKKPPSADRQYRSAKSHSIGVSGIYWLDKSLGVALGLYFSRKGYRVDYDFIAVNPQDPVAFPDHTKFRLSYMEFPAGLTYRVFTKNKCSLSFSSGVVMSLMAGSRVHTRFFNGEKKSTGYYSSDNADFIWGASLGIRLGYTLYKSLRIYLEPDYVYYFNPVDKAIMNAGTRALKTRIGISLHM